MSVSADSMVGRAGEKTLFQMLLFTMSATHHSLPSLTLSVAD